jgi:hypothetical protein
MSRPRSKKPVAPSTDSSAAPVVVAGSARSANAQPGLPPRYLEACRLAEEGEYEDARRAYGKLEKSTSRSNARLRGLVRNDLAVLAAIDVLSLKEDRHFASVDRALNGFNVRLNLAVLAADMGDLAEAELQWRAVVCEVPLYRAGWRGLAETLLGR